MSKDGLVNYNQPNGNFTGNIDLGNSIPTGIYTVKIKSDQFLNNFVPGIQRILQNQTNILPLTILTSGDINNDNRINVLDYNILIDCFSDLKPARNCSDHSKKLSSDITDEGDVKKFDYNLFLRELNNIKGDSRFNNSQFTVNN